MKEQSVSTNIKELNDLIEKLKKVTAQANRTSTDLQKFGNSINFQKATSNINAFYKSLEKFDSKMRVFDAFSTRIGTLEQRISSLSATISKQLVTSMDNFSKATTQLNKAPTAQKQSAGATAIVSAPQQEQTMRGYIEELERILALKEKIAYATKEDLLMMQQVVATAKEQNPNESSAAFPKYSTKEQLVNKADKNVVQSEEALISAYLEQNVEIQRNKVLLQDRNKVLRQAAKDTLNASKVNKESAMIITAENVANARNAIELKEREKTIKDIAKAQLILEQATERIALAEAKLASSTKLSRHERRQLKNEIKDYSEVVKYTQASLEGLNSAQGAAGNATRKWNAAQFNVIQVIRELPNFAISARIGLQSLSNNLPMLAESLLASGKAAAFLQRHLIALNLAFVALTILIMNIGNIVKFFKDLAAGGGALAKSIREVSEEIAKNKGELNTWGQKVLDISAKLHATSIAMYSQADALREYNKELGDLFGKASTAAEAIEKLNQKTEAYFQILVIGMIQQKIMEKNLNEYGDKIIKDVTNTMSSAIGGLESIRERAMKLMPQQSKTWNEIRARLNNVAWDLENLAKKYGGLDAEQQALIKRMRQGVLTVKELDELIKSVNKSMSESMAKTLGESQRFKQFSSQTEQITRLLATLQQEIAKAADINLFPKDKGGAKGAKEHVQTAKSLDIAYKEYSEQAAKYGRELEHLNRIIDEEGVTTEVNKINDRRKAWLEYFELRKKIANETLATEIENYQESYRKEKERLDKAIRQNAQARRQINAILAADKAKPELTDEQIQGYKDKLVEVEEAARINAQSRINIEKNYHEELHKITDSYVATIQKDYYDKISKYHSILMRQLQKDNKEITKSLNKDIAELSREFETIVNVMQNGFSGGLFGKLLGDEKYLNRINKSLGKTKIQLSSLSDANLFVTGITGSNAKMWETVQAISRLNLELDNYIEKTEREKTAINDRINLQKRLIEALNEVALAQTLTDTAKAALIKKAQSKIVGEDKKSAKRREKIALMLKDKLAAIEKMTGEERKAALQEVNKEIEDLQEDLAQKDTDVNNKRAEIMAARMKEARKEIRDLSLDFIREVAAMMDAIVDATIEHERQMLNAWQEESTQRVDEQLKSEVISKEQAEAQKEAIAWEVRKKQYEINKKEDAYKKSRALFDIGIATAVAIMNAWAGVAGMGIAGIVLGAIMTALISGAAIAQTVAVLSKPAPTFAEGVVDYDPTKYSPIFGQNKALVGEKGTELRVTKGGQIEVLDKPQIITMQKGDTIIPNSDLAMAGMLISSFKAKDDNSPADFVSGQKETNKLLRKIAEKEFSYSGRNYNLHWR